MCIYEWCCWFFFPTLASSPPTEEKVLTKITARDQVQVVLNRLHKLLRDFKMTSYTCTHRGYSKRWPINCTRQKKKKNCGSLQTVAPCFWCMQTLLCGSLEGDDRLEVFLVLKSLQFGGWCSLQLDLRSTVHSQAKARFLAGQMNKDACVDNARRTRQAALDELPYWLKVLRLLTTGLASYFSPKCFASKFMITYRPRQLRSSIPRLTSNSLADTSLWTR